MVRGDLYGDKYGDPRDSWEHHMQRREYELRRHYEEKMHMMMQMQAPQVMSGSLGQAAQAQMNQAGCAGNALSAAVEKTKPAPNKLLLLVDG